MKTLYVYSRAGCGGCNLVKNFLDRLDVPYTELNIDVDRAARNRMDRDGHRFVPQIYIDDQQFAGGWRALKTMRQHEVLNFLK